MKILVAAIALAFSFPALATCTWTQDAGLRSGTMVCTSANEGIPTTTAQGWQFTSCPKGVTVFICADSGKVLTGSGTLKVALYHPVAALWGEVPDLAMNPTATTRCQGFAGMWTVVEGGRIAVYPVSVGVDAGGLTAYFSCN